MVWGWCWGLGVQLSVGRKMVGRGGHSLHPMRRRGRGQLLGGWGVGVVVLLRVLLVGGQWEGVQLGL